MADGHVAVFPTAAISNPTDSTFHTLPAGTTCVVLMVKTASYNKSLPPPTIELSVYCITDINFTLLPNSIVWPALNQYGNLLLSDTNISSPSIFIVG
ncbi:MAG TPA: hypothetical protein P5250_01925 [Bacteroidales bacterium]|nr:hypothetical protein [Bacteroidales bacterium]